MANSLLENLYIQYRGALCAYLFHKIQDADLTEDLVQEAFLRLFVAQLQQKKIKNVRAYLYRMVNNLLIDHVRQQQAQRTDNYSKEVLAEIRDEERVPIVEQVSQLEQQQLIREAIKQLPIRTQQILILNRFEGLTHAQVATLLGISDSLVQKHLAKARQYLKEYFTR